MTTLKLLRVVIASPSDVKAERKALDRVIERVNRNTAEGLGLVLKAVRWETDSYPGFHVEGPQGLIDSILNIEDCDILIGILWKRFGTPTVRDGKTGTEHEFYKAYEAWKQNKRPHIMMYFSKKPYYPESPEETEQQKAVLNFEKSLSKGLLWTYKSLQEFKDYVEDHLTSYIQRNFKNPSAVLKNQEQPIENMKKEITSGGISTDFNSVSELIKKGRFLIRQNMYIEAINKFDKALAIDPKNVKAWNGKGDALRHLQRYDDANNAFDIAIDIDATYADVLKNKGLVLNDLGKFGKAIEYFDKALAIDPKHFGALRGKGSAFYKSGNYSEALKYFDKALAIDPHNLDASINKEDALRKLSNRQ